MTTNPVVPVRVCHMPRIKHTYCYTCAYMFHKEQFYKNRVRNLILQVQYRWVSNFTYKPWAHESHIKQKHKVYCIYILSRSSITIKTYQSNDALLKDNITATTTYSSPVFGSTGQKWPNTTSGSPATWFKSNLSTKVLARLTQLHIQGSCNGSSKSFKVK